MKGGAPAPDHVVTVGVELSSISVDRDGNESAQLFIRIPVQAWMKLPRRLLPNVIPKLAQSSGGMVPQEQIGELQVCSSHPTAICKKRNQKNRMKHSTKPRLARTARLVDSVVKFVGKNNMRGHHRCQLLPFNLASDLKPGKKQRQSERLPNFLRKACSSKRIS